MNIPPAVLEFHTRMLNDRKRTASYLEAIRTNVRPGDVVLDIGTGTGIYAVAAVQAGARHVYAIEAGRVASAARALFRANGLVGRVTLIRGTSGRIWLPERANVLISEVIGDEPLGEGVIGITKDALRRLLSLRPVLIPSGVKMFALPVTIPSEELADLTVTPETLQRWRSWYGIEFGPLERARESMLSRRFGYFVNPNKMRNWTLLSAPVLLADIDLRRWKIRPVFQTQAVTVETGGLLNGIMVYFELRVGQTTFLSTHPTAVDDSNHWQSPVRVLPQPSMVKAGDRFQLTYWYRLREAISGCEVDLLH